MSVGTVVSVSTGVATLIGDERRSVMSGIVKTPVAGPVDVGPEGLAGDVQVNRAVHGGHEQAVYVYDAAALAWWARHLDREMPPGLLGENLLVAGVAVDDAPIGTVWAVGEVRLRLRSPRTACDKLAIRMGDRGFRATFAAAGRPGAYCRVDRPGTVRAGDTIEVVEVPDHGVTVAHMAAARHGDTACLRRLADPAVLAHLADDDVAWVHRAVARQDRT